MVDYVKADIRMNERIIRGILKFGTLNTFRENRENRENTF